MQTCWHFITFAHPMGFTGRCCTGSHAWMRVLAGSSVLVLANPEWGSSAKLASQQMLHSRLHSSLKSTALMSRTTLRISVLLVRRQLWGCPVKDASTLSYLEIIPPWRLVSRAWTCPLELRLLFSFQHVFHCVVSQVDCLSLLMQTLLITKAYISIF